MAVLDAVKRAIRPDDDEYALDKAFLAKINEGRMNLERIAPQRDECWEFYRGNHFAYVSDSNKLAFLAAGAIGIPRRGKPTNRARQARNFIYDIVLRQASDASQQVPSYQVVPSTTDPDDAAAASLAQKVALYGYDRWGIRQVTVDAVIQAVVGGEAFAWVYFDNTIGPFISDEEGSIGQGDVRIRVYGANQCFWVPGLRFHESPWHCVEQACDPEQLKNTPGFIGGTLTADADTRALSGKKSDNGKLVVRTDYLEKPCPKYPEGRWITLANQQRIFEDRPYPGTGESPVLRPLVYAPDPDNDRDLGLVRQLLDPQRTKDDSENKAVEWKNMALVPQWVVAPGVMKKQRRTDEPGKLYEIPQPNENVKVLDPPAIPQGLFDMGDRAVDDMLRIAAQMDPPQGTESGKAYQVWIEQNKARLALFFASLAKFQQDIMHDCLVQVQENYTEPRLLQVKGDFGWEPLEDFKGAQLRDQVDVRVFVDSIEPQTRQAREQRIMNYIQIGAISPTEGMTAIETGATEGLIRSFSQDESRVSRIIQRLKQGPEALGAMPMLPTGRLDEMGMPEMAPGWMPRYSDNLGIFRTTFEDWLKSEDYERQLPEVQQAANEIYAGVLQLEVLKAQEEQMAQMQQAEQLGMDNAAKPQVNGKPNPSLPSVNES